MRPRMQLGWKDNLPPAAWPLSQVLAIHFRTGEAFPTVRRESGHLSSPWFDICAGFRASAFAVQFSRSINLLRAAQRYEAVHPA
jgi:hypothetical protein